MASRDFELIVVEGNKVSISKAMGMGGSEET